MTTDDKELLWDFVTRMAMFIHPVNADTISSFIHGYNAGARGACTLIDQLIQLLKSKYKVAHDADGWPGQIKRLAKKRSSTWVVVFRSLTLELIVQEQGGCLTEQQQATLKRKITQFMIQLEKVTSLPLRPFASFDIESIEEWFSLCAVKSTWFKQLWTEKEWVDITKFNKLMQAQSLLPTGWITSASS